MHNRKLAGKKKIILMKYTIISPTWYVVSEPCGNASLFVVWASWRGWVGVEHVTICKVNDRLPTIP